MRRLKSVRRRLTMSARSAAEAASYLNNKNDGRVHTVEGKAK